MKLGCDHKVCATCENKRNECVLPCKNNCSSCDSNTDCLGCIDGYYLENGNCL